LATRRWSRAARRAGSPAVVARVEQAHGGVVADHEDTSGVEGGLLSEEGCRREDKGCLTCELRGSAGGLRSGEGTLIGVAHGQIKGYRRVAEGGGGGSHAHVPRVQRVERSREDRPGGRAVDLLRAVRFDGDGANSASE